MQEQLAGLLGSEAVIPPEQLDRYAVDGVIPRAAVRPSSPQAVAEVLRWASSQRVSVFPRGGGTQTALGNVPSRVDLVLELDRQGRILDYQPADLTVTVEAGVTLHDLQQELAQGGKFLPLEAPLAEKTTIGGVLAANATGPLRSTYGLPRDWLIGIGAVSAGGVATKAGGKVVKNVTGYDLNKLYAGSLGTLAVIVEATFKLAPLPADSGTLVAAFPTLEEGITAGGRLMRQVFAPQGVQVIDGLAAHRLNAAPDSGSFDPSGPRPIGGGRWPQLGTSGAATLAFFTGRPRAVQRKLEEGELLLRETGATDIVRLGSEEGGRVLRRLTDLGWGGDTQPYLGIKVSVPPSAVASVVGRCRREAALGLPPGVEADPGFGTVRLSWWAESVSNWIDESLVFSTIGRVRELARDVGGSTVVERCPLPLKKRIDVWGGASQGMEIVRRIKQKFDPLGILNPGRFVGRI